jgi:cysteine-rich secretory family protein
VCAVLALPVGAEAQQDTTPVQRMAQLVNEARIAQGLNPVAISQELTAAADAHTLDMVAFGYADHQGRDGSSPQHRAVRHGYSVPPASGWIVVEVLSGRPTADAAAGWLLTDRLHRGVMLGPRWREMGISHAKGGPWGHIWTIKFGCRPNVLPVLPQAAPSGGISLRLTNEECAPGGGPDQIGKATDLMLSERSDFQGAVWEPFVTTKPVSTTSGSVFVKLRDARGRQVTTTVTNPAGNVSAAARAPASARAVVRPLIDPAPPSFFLSTTQQR